MGKEQRRFTRPLNYALFCRLTPEQQWWALFRAWQDLIITIWREVPSIGRITWSCTLDGWDCSMIADVVA